MDSAASAFDTSTAEPSCLEEAHAAAPVADRWGPPSFAGRPATPLSAQDGRPRIVARVRTPRISVVIPTRNEAENLRHVLRELPSGLHEVIIVDGFSTDDTLAVAEQLRPDAVIIRQTRAGKGDALRCGFDATSGDVVVMLDADGSADPAEIPRFVDALVAGADFAKGSRFAEGGGSDDLTRLRRAGNWFFSAAVNTLFHTNYSDLCYGYNAFWRHCLPAMSVDCDGFEIETLINIRIARACLLVTEVPSYERQRIHGESNLRPFRDGAKVLRTIARERLRRRPGAHHQRVRTDHLPEYQLGEAVGAQSPNV
jgi:glycosyltransferase involved in cell wall biosynthesis